MLREDGGSTPPVGAGAAAADPNSGPLPHSALLATEPLSLCRPPSANGAAPLLPAATLDCDTGRGMAGAAPGARAKVEAAVPVLRSLTCRPCDEADTEAAFTTGAATDEWPPPTPGVPATGGTVAGDGGCDTCGTEKATLPATPPPPLRAVGLRATCASSITATEPPDGAAATAAAAAKFRVLAARRVTATCPAPPVVDAAASCGSGSPVEAPALPAVTPWPPRPL
jgi:hypothetical protein